MSDNNMKSRIIPDDMKNDIDEILEKQLFNANRYYAVSNSDIYRLMEIEKIKKSVDYLSELKRRWNWHNYFYEELLEPAFFELTYSSEKELSPKQIEELIKIYNTCCSVDAATLVSSGGIKMHLKYQMDNMSLECENVSREDAAFMLLTPPTDSFFVQYEIDHLSYLIAQKNNLKETEKIKKYLLKKYHANDDAIFKSRFNKKYANKLNCSVDKLLQDIASYKISDEYKVKHYYFTLEHPERRAFRDIITYDNVDEKLISSQLIGISGFLFRKQILKYLNDSKKLINKGFIYEFYDDCVIGALNELLNERKKIMEKDIKPYKQRGMTCAIACMLMVLEYYNIIPKADWQYEKKYFRIYRSNIMPGTPFSALAWHFSKNDLETEVIHSEKEIFVNCDNLLSEGDFEKAMDEYKSFLNVAKTKGASVINGAKINSKMLKKKLQEDKLIILAGRYGEYLHAILLCGYEKDNFIVCDPQYKNKQIKSFDEINSFMSTPLGKWCVTVSQKNKNKDKLMERLDQYQTEAMKKLDASEYKKNVDYASQQAKIKRCGD